MSEAVILTGQQRKILREAILGAYPNPDELQILLSEQMDVQLGAIARGDAYNARVFSLIQDFEADGRIKEFIRVVVEDKPNSPYLTTAKVLSNNSSKLGKIDRISNLSSLKKVTEDPLILVGYRLNSYVIQELIGMGGSGLVYRGWNCNLGQQVCIKIFYPLKPDNISLITILYHGLHRLASLDHPSIVKIFDFAQLKIEEETSFYVVMEYVDGKTLDVWGNKTGGISPPMSERLKVALKIATALRDAHNCKYIDEVGFEQKGILHGDIKPSNILVRYDNSPVLIDFMMVDLQRLLDPKIVPSYILNDSMKARMCTAAFGTPGFMAPEQEKRGVVTEKTDIYSLGVTFGDLFFPDSSYTLQISAPKTSDNLYNLKTLLIQMSNPFPENRPKDMSLVVKQLRKISQEEKEKK